jgi:SAM-dependent methyltransferase
MIIGLLKRIKAKIKRLLPSDHKKIFTDIYKKNLWGSNGSSKFYSGSGSDYKYSAPYTQLIIDFIRTNDVKQVVDLGCGDFRVGKSIVDSTHVNYIGIDVVKELVDYNNEIFASPNIHFKSINITRDKLPSGELCLIRQVLQHLSNSDILAVLNKTKKYKYLIITEHLPDINNPIPNIDKYPDGDIRYSRGSGVYLNLPPFNRKIKELLSVAPQEHPNSKIVTFQVLS